MFDGITLKPEQMWTLLSGEILVLEGEGPIENHDVKLHFPHTEDNQKPVLDYLRGSALAKGKVLLEVTTETMNAVGRLLLTDAVIWDDRHTERLVELTGKLLAGE
jgi:hypothetical protein